MSTCLPHRQERHAVYAAKEVCTFARWTRKTKTLFCHPTFTYFIQIYIKADFIVMPYLVFTPKFSFYASCVGEHHCPPHVYNRNVLPQEELL